MSIKTTTSKSCCMLFTPFVLYDILKIFLIFDSKSIESMYTFVSLNRKEVTFIGINCKYSESHVLTCCHSYLAFMGKNQHTYMFIFNNSVITYQRCVLLYFKPLWTEQFLSSSSSFLLHFNWFLKQYDI